MFNQLVIEGLLIYAAIVGLIGYSLSRQAPTTGRKIAVWLLLIILSFPGAFFWIIIWSAIIGALADSPVR